VCRRFESPRGHVCPGQSLVSADSRVSKCAVASIVVRNRTSWSPHSAQSGIYDWGCDRARSPSRQQEHQDHPRTSVVTTWRSSPGAAPSRSTPLPAAPARPWTEQDWHISRARSRASSDSRKDNGLTVGQGAGQPTTYLIQVRWETSEEFVEFTDTRRPPPDTCRKRDERPVPLVGGGVTIEGAARFPLLDNRRCPMAFIEFMASKAGRWARAVAGLVLIAIGVMLGGGWWALAVIGLVPLAAGVFDFCVLAPLVRRPFRGSDFRAGLQHH